MYCCATGVAGLCVTHLLLSSPCSLRLRRDMVRRTPKPPDAATVAGCGGIEAVGHEVEESIGLGVEETLEETLCLDVLWSLALSSCLAADAVSPSPPPCPSAVCESRRRCLCWAQVPPRAVALGRARCLMHETTVWCMKPLFDA